jgi:hypothetical protein
MERFWQARLALIDCLSLITMMKACIMIAVLVCASAGEWELVFRQTMPEVKPVNDWYNVNSDDSSNPNYSILDDLQLNGEDYKIDGKFHFRMGWPGATGAGNQEWSQTSNPMTVVANSGGVQGYEAIDVSHTTQNWGGLEYNGVSSVMDGSAAHGHWYYAVGSVNKWGNAIPGWTNAEDVTELWVKKAVAVSTCSVHCSLSSGILIATHDTTSGHATHMCFKDDTASNGCTCTCL